MKIELSDSIGKDIITSNGVKIPMKTRNIDWDESASLCKPLQDLPAQVSWLHSYPINSNNQRGNLITLII